MVDKPFVKVLNGLRRSGKSTIMTMLIEHLTKKGVSNDQIIYLNFESMQFSFISDYVSLYKIVQKKINTTTRTYIFVDEIQEVSGWEKAINSFLVDFEVDIYITGSNSRLLSSELSTYLAGRYREFHIQPLSFAETIDFYNSRKTIDLPITEQFENYRKLGGFPALHIADYELESAYQIVYDIYSSTILRDTIQRFKIRDIELLERVIKFALENVGNTFSASSIVKYFKSQYRKIDINTVYNYLNALESSYVLYKLSRYDIKGKDILKTQEKYYPGDIAFIYALMGYRDDQIAGILETLVFLELKRREYQIYVGKIQNIEIDFVAVKNNEKVYIQVAYKLSSKETIEREFIPLTTIKDNYPKYVVTMENVWQSNYEGIRHVNISEFLLMKKF
jgi:predicted AAA+ superfamily ATPase